MVARALGAEFRATTVCIDSYDNNVLTGRFYNPYLSGGKDFQSVTQFLLEMEKALDSMDFPKSYTATRTFAHTPENITDYLESEYSPGEIATFVVKVLFRQNASWQGSVTWLEGQQEQSFRSVLELILLIDNALGYEKAS